MLGDEQKLCKYRTLNLPIQTEANLLLRDELGSFN